MKEKLLATPAQVQQIEDLSQSGLTPHQIARALGVIVADVNRIVLEAQQRRRSGIQELLKVNFGEPLVLHGDNWMVTSDWHVPETDWGMIERMIAIAQKHLRPPRQLVIAGDFFSQSQFSQYAALVPPAPWAQERDAAREILLTLLETFADIWIVMGNHDRRLIKWSAANLDESDVFGMVIQNPRVHVNKFAYCTLETTHGKWRATHPDAYRQKRGVTPGDLADRLDMNVISGHEHHSSLSVSPSGKHTAVSIGGLYDTSKIAYVQLTDSLRPAMVPGFSMLLDGYPYLFVDGVTNWQTWGA